MKIAIGCDPNAENEKQALMKFIEDKGLGEVEDFGSTESRSMQMLQLRLERQLLRKNMTEESFFAEPDLEFLLRQIK